MLGRSPKTFPTFILIPSTFAPLLLTFTFTPPPTPSAAPPAAPTALSPPPFPPAGGDEKNDVTGDMDGVLPSEYEAEVGRLLSGDDDGDGEWVRWETSWCGCGCGCGGCGCWWLGGAAWAEEGVSGSCERLRGLLLSCMGSMWWWLAEEGDDCDVCC